MTGTAEQLAVEQRGATVDILFYLNAIGRPQTRREGP